MVAHPAAPAIDNVVARVQETIPEIERIERIPLDLSKLDNEGIFIAVTTNGFKALDKKLSWQALGITLPQNLSISIRSPHVGLLPDTYRLPITRVSQQAYDAVERWGMKLSVLESLFGVTSYRWLPYSAWPKFKADWDLAQNNLAEAVKRVEDDWPTIEMTVVNDFRRVVGDAVIRARSTGGMIADDFQERMIDQLEKMLPTPERLKSTLSIEYRVAVLSLASSTLEEQARAIEARREIERQNEAAWLEQQERGAKAEMARAADDAERALIWDRLRLEREELSRKARIQQELDQAKLDEAKKRMSEALSPLDEGLKQLHAVVFEAVSTVRDSMAKTGYLHGPSAEKVRKLAEWVKTMNVVFGDSDLATKIETLEALAQSPIKGEKRDVAKIEESLDDLKALTVAAFRDLNQTHRYDVLEL